MSGKVSGDDEQGWRAYEPPDTPSRDQPDESGWSVYGDRYEDPPPPPPPSHGVRKWVYRVRRLPSWYDFTAGRKLGLLVAGVVLSAGAASAVLDATGGEGGQTQEAVAQLDTLDEDNLDLLARKLRRETGSTLVTRLVVLEDSVVVWVPAGDEDTVYTWRGGALRPTRTEPHAGPAFDLTDRVLGDVARAGRKSHALRGETHEWRVTAQVPEGDTEPLVTARAIHDDGLVVVHIDSDGKVWRET